MKKKKKKKEEGRERKSNASKYRIAYGKLRFEEANVKTFILDCWQPSSKVLFIVLITRGEP